MISFQELKERKLVQWALAYLAGAWLLLQVIDLIGGYFGWPLLVGQIGTVLLAMGFFAALVVAWYHGEKGQQKVSTVELGLLAGVLVLAGVGVAWVRTSSSAPASGVDPPSPAFTESAPVAEQGSIAVLPFVNMSSDPEQEYFSDGLTEELLNVLAQIPELRVAARTSAFAFKEKDVGIDSIARALKVRHVLEGSVRKAGDRVRITAQLIDASNGYHLWSHAYDRELKDVFAIQGEISRAIVDELQLQLSGGRDQGALAKVETTDPEAHTLVLKAQQIVRQGTREASAQAEALLKQAIERDSRYARAHAELAGVYEGYVYRGYISRKAGLARVRATAERALALDSMEARAHLVLGVIEGDYEWNWREAERHYARALELNPSLSAAHGLRAWLLMRLGRSEAAIRTAERAVQLDPVSPSAYNNAGAMYLYAGQTEKGREMMEQALQLSPGNPALLSNLAFMCSLLDRHTGAIRTAQQAVEAAPNVPAALGSLAYAHARAGQSAHAEALLKRLQALSEVGAYSLATVHAGLGNREQVLMLLERAVEERDPYAPDLAVDPIFRGYQNEPRVQRLLRQMGLG